MTRILKEGKHPDGSLKSRKTELHGQPRKRMILKECWYLPKVNPLDPWQATDNAQQRDGRQGSKLTYVNGQQHDVQEYWYQNGQQQSKENYVNGQKHGVQEAWFDNGQQQSKENYVNGQKHGVQEAWFDNGQQWYKFNYVNGQKHGVQEAWNPSRVDPSDPWQATDSAQQRGGQQWYKYNYVNEQYHGVQKEWYEDGQLKSRKYYLDGVEVSQRAYQAYIAGYLKPDD